MSLNNLSADIFAPYTAILFIARHGNTFETGETPRRIGWRTDLPLTAEGTRQCERLGVGLARLMSAGGLSLQGMACSPLLRTRQSAAALLAAMNAAVDVRYLDFLREIDHGAQENLPEPLVIAALGAQALAAWDAALILPPGWSADEAAIAAGWRDLAADLATATQTTQKPCMIAVTSGGIARYAAHLLDDPMALAHTKVPANSHKQSFKLPTGGLAALGYHPPSTSSPACWEPIFWGTQGF